MQGIIFGSLTAKNIQSISFEEFDVNKDGQITEEEVVSLLGEQALDILDLSTIDKDADQKVTEDEYILWQQEAEIKSTMDDIKKQVARDFIGQDNDDIKKVLNALEEFQQGFIANGIALGKILSMSEEFKQILPAKYSEIKFNALKNTKSAIKMRVIESVIQNVEQETRLGGRSFLGIVNNNGLGILSDNARRLLGNELSKEADKYAKKYSGDDYENDLFKHLKTFLQESDKSKLADAISIWDKSKEEIANMSSEIKLLKLKDSAKNLLLMALEQGISLKLGDISIRTEVAIAPALAQFKDTVSLEKAVDKLISELSAYSKLEQIKQAAAGTEQEQVPSVPEDLFILDESSTQANIFN